MLEKQHAWERPFESLAAVLACFSRSSAKSPVRVVDSTRVVVGGSRCRDAGVAGPQVCSDSSLAFFAAA
ncbi:hypothetical protein SKAU_G00430050 [Synaphobranchus kaupii]|uniref:Uncharacterized protein n=1 Tax=Synaphobranchus kaupii TaxID=118154 RepID=A0A9Q1I9X0_SYNKA|nr:hypothetical protein SKAU_G00430050 [Synaphobranchus kaupii]